MEIKTANQLFEFFNDLRIRYVDSEEIRLGIHTPIRVYIRIKKLFNFKNTLILRQLHPETSDWVLLSKKIFPKDLHYSGGILKVGDYIVITQLKKDLG